MLPEEAHKMITIPRQLHGCRFILLRPHGKEPIESNWHTTSNYSHDDPKVLAHLAADGNYGVLLGNYNGGDIQYVVIDADDASLEKLIKEKLPPTFTVR